jgi:hypothetical protein
MKGPELSKREVTFSNIKFYYLIAQIYGVRYYEHNYIQDGGHGAMNTMIHHQRTNAARASG